MNTFARVRKLFKTRESKEVRLVDLSEHLRRDLGLHETNSSRRVNHAAPKTEEYIVFNAFKRGP